MLWFKGEQQLLDLMDWLKDQDPAIKFTANYGTADIPYLDVSLSITDGHISTKFVITHNRGNPPLVEWLKKCIMPVLHSS